MLQGRPRLGSDEWCLSKVFFLGYHCMKEWRLIVVAVIIKSLIVATYSFLISTVNDWFEVMIWD